MLIPLIEAHFGTSFYGSDSELRVRNRPRGAGGSPERKRRGKQPKRATKRGEELLKGLEKCPCPQQLKQGCVFSRKGRLVVGFWVVSLMSFVLWKLLTRYHVFRIRPPFVFRMIFLQQSYERTRLRNILR